MDLPLSLRSSMTSAYRDEARADGTYLYDYAPARFERSNEAARRASDLGTPMILLLDLGAGQWLPTYPVFIVADEPEARRFHVSSSARGVAKTTATAAVDPGYEYTLQPRRLHQRHFRVLVLAAYEERCAMCHLRHASLLDAAHIRPDREETAVLASRGVSLCKIHHAAFDVHYVGIEPLAEPVIRVRRDILSEEDGPMLRHGIQEMDRRPLLLPRLKTNHPDRDALEDRWQRFKEAG